MLLSVLGAVGIAGAIANAASKMGEHDGLSTGQMVEGMLSDGAKGAGVALLGALVLYTTVWWVHRGIDTVRRRAMTQVSGRPTDP